MGVYVALLLLTTWLGYLQAVQGNLSASEIQSNLQRFSVTIFVCLAILVTLAAPALTAISIVMEQQLLTLDLLTTTSMSGVEMLLGKLLSSFAFFLLLLVLSFPASGLCVVLGGATFSDLIKVYGILLGDGVLLSSIGLIFSCSAKKNVEAILRTYIVVIAFLIGTAVCAALGAASAGGTGSGSSAGSIVQSFAFLNPFVTVFSTVSFSGAVSSISGSISIAGFHIPTYVFVILFAFLFTWNNLTVAAVRLSLYGETLVKKLKIQTLIIVFLVGFVIMSAYSASSIGSAYSGLPAGAAAAAWIAVVTGVLFLLSSFSLPTLFIPQYGAEDSLPKKYEGWFRGGNALGSAPSGSLPYFVLLFVVVVLSGIFSQMCNARGDYCVTYTSPPFFKGWGFSLDAPLLGSAVFYIFGLAILFWSICRRMAWLATSKKTAAILGFFVFFAIMTLPLMIYSFPDQILPNAMKTKFLQYTWLLAPGADTLSLFDKMKPDIYFKCIYYGFAAYVLSILFYPFWRPLSVGNRAGKKKAK